MTRMQRYDTFLDVRMHHVSDTGCAVLQLQEVRNCYFSDRSLVLCSLGMFVSALLTHQRVAHVSADSILQSPGLRAQWPEIHSCFRGPSAGLGPSCRQLCEFIRFTYPHRHTH